MVSKQTHNKGFMYRAPQKQHARHDADYEQMVQSYDQGYEARRLGKAYKNPWNITRQNPDAFGGVARTQYFGWEHELNMWFYNGYYDWTPGDWVPWLKDEEQGEYAINPKTGKSRKYLRPGVAFPKESWNEFWISPTLDQPAVVNLNPVMVA